MTFRSWHFLVFVFTLCVSAILAAHWMRTHSDRNVEGFADRLPPGVQAWFKADLETLRNAGILDSLTGEAADQDTDYRRFVEQSGFDFRRDLDTVLVATSPTATYVFAAGDFNWKQLTVYATGNGGTCRNGLCRMPASTMGRWISFFPLRNRVLALAVAADQWEATRLHAEQPNATRISVPADQAIWLRSSGALLSQSSLVPITLRPFVNLFANSQQVDFSVGAAAPTGVAVRFSAQLPDPGQATSLRDQLTSLTQRLKTESGPIGEADPLAEALRSGAYSTSGSTATGSWNLSSLVQKR